ncbi:MAG: HlyC/CorC family transporter [Rhodothermales bacterium]|nr:HlyC/CorC family transporter [Rhodothermales bacterium]MBO6778504.1 HlyC/CorC family transporter [Rhodothermales bacterium]
MLYVILIVVTLALSAFFSGSEIAFVTANRLRVEVVARRSGFSGPLVQRFLKDPSTLLTTTLVGNNLALVTYSTLLALFLEPPLSELFTQTMGVSEQASDVLVLMVQTLIGSAVVLVVGEIIPKSLMREVASQAVFALALPLRITYIVLLPFIKVAGLAAGMIIRFAKGDGDTLSRFIRRDFELMIEESKLSGELDLDEEETALLSNVFAMGSIRVKESMVPRTEIAAVEENTPIEELMGEFVRTGHSKLPVYRENIDNVVGVVFAYDLFSDPASLQEMLREPTFIPETKLSKDQLRDFLEAKTSIAIVIDEYGGTAGLVTAEDLLEELFGDIQDEFDTETEIIRQLDERTIVASARLELDELEAKMGWKLPPGDYETVSGYLLSRLGTIPAMREEFDEDGFRFTVLEATANRLELLRIRHLEGE